MCVLSPKQTLETQKRQTILSVSISKSAFKQNWKNNSKWGKKVIWFFIKMVPTKFYQHNVWNTKYLLNMQKMLEKSKAWGEKIKNNTRW